MTVSSIGIIRPAQDEDWQQIYALIERVFLRSDEAKFMQNLNDNEDVVISLVHARGEDINGFIAFSRILLENNDELYDALALAPLVVDPIWQGKGIGKDLIRAAHKYLSEAGEKMAFVLGEPGYYGQLGYSPEAASEFKGPYSGPYLLGLRCSADIPASGRLIYPQAFSLVS